MFLVLHVVLFYEALLGRRSSFHSLPARLAFCTWNYVEDTKTYHITFPKAKPKQTVANTALQVLQENSGATAEGSSLRTLAKASNVNLFSQLPRTTS